MLKRKSFRCQDRRFLYLIYLGVGVPKDVDVRCEQNHIYFYTEVDRKSALEVIRLIKNISEDMNTIADRMDSPNGPNPIYLHINSYGGSIFAALSIVDAILESKVPVISVIEGCAASAATLISCVASKRYIKRHAHMLLHELRSSFWGKMQDIEDEVDNLKELMKLIVQLYKKHTDLPSNEIKNILQKDIWWNSEICIKHGIVDGYWDERNDS